MGPSRVNPYNFLPQGFSEMQDGNIRRLLWGESLVDIFEGLNNS